MVQDGPIRISHETFAVMSFYNQGNLFYSLGCSNRIPQTGWLINNRDLFLTVPETGKSKIKALEDVVSDEGSPPDS